jgi:hypothetical protein
LRRTNHLSRRAHLEGAAAYQSLPRVEVRADGKGMTGRAGLKPPRPGRRPGGADRRTATHPSADAGPGAGMSMAKSSVIWC